MIAELMVFSSSFVLRCHGVEAMATLLPLLLPFLFSSLTVVVQASLFRHNSDHSLLITALQWLSISLRVKARVFTMVCRPYSAPLGLCSSHTGLLAIPQTCQVCSHTSSLYTCFSLYLKCYLLPQIFTWLASLPT